MNRYFILVHLRTSNMAVNIIVIFSSQIQENNQQCKIFENIQHLAHSRSRGIWRKELKPHIKNLKARKVCKSWEVNKWKSGKHFVKSQAESEKIRNTRQKSIYAKSCVKQFLKFALLLSVLWLVLFLHQGGDGSSLSFFLAFDYPEAGEKWIFKSLKYIGDKMSLANTI